MRLALIFVCPRRVFLFLDPDGLVPKKYKKKPNPNTKNKRARGESGTGTRKGDASRNRNIGHDDAEEHQRNNSGRSGGTTRGGHRGGKFGIGTLLPSIIEEGCARGEVPCTICRDLGAWYPGFGLGWPFDACDDGMAKCLPIDDNRG